MGLEAQMQKRNVSGPKLDGHESINSFQEASLKNSTEKINIGDVLGNNQIELINPSH